MSERVLICGTRDWTMARAMLREINAFVDALPLDTIVIHGDATGVDNLADCRAKRRGLSRWAFPAWWDLLGRSAGPRRNQRMLDEAKPDRVVAFHPQIESSGGTKDMVGRARALGIPVEVVAGRPEGAAGEEG